MTCGNKKQDTPDVYLHIMKQSYAFILRVALGWAINCFILVVLVANFIPLIKNASHRNNDDQLRRLDTSEFSGDTIIDISFIAATHELSRLDASDFTSLLDDPASGDVAVMLGMDGFIRKITAGDNDAAAERVALTEGMRPLVKMVKNVGCRDI